MDEAEILAVIEDRVRDPSALAARLPDGAREIACETRVNPTCGDRVELSLHLGEGRVHLRGQVTGCALSTAAAVVLAEAVEGASSTSAADVVAQLADHRLRGGELPDLTRLGSAATGVMSGVEEGKLSVDAAGERSAAEAGEAADSLTGLATMEVVPLRRRCIAFPWTLAADILAGITVDDRR